MVACLYQYQLAVAVMVAGSGLGKLTEQRRLQVVEVILQG